MTERTQVGIVGAGPAGLLLSHMLHLAGVESVVFERGNREHVGTRLRAGGLEHGAVALLERVGLGARMRKLALSVAATDFRFDGCGHRVDFRAITGHPFTIYPQYEIVSDLLEARAAAGGEVRFDTPVRRIDGLESARPVIHYEAGGSVRRLECDFIAGCDGYHGVCRQAIPASVQRVFEENYPFGWLGILAEVAPPSLEVAYACHERGFAMQSFRAPTISRMYLQCPPDDRADNWSDERIWSELALRLDVPDRPPVARGPIVQKSVTAMKSFVVEPLSYGTLFLAGDAAHIVPPTGAKGLNSAMADIALLAPAFAAFYRTGRREGLDGYSAACLRRTWQVQRFAAEMCTLLHRFPGASDYAWRLQREKLAYMTGTATGMRTYAESFVGLPFEP
ncbi:MAG: 4-hydroxybenzoate 3-monooxygenase [Burkholderiales bacterium]|nr:4-hydroxybenzoate 3-monooxygenase [Burkholderiales bacterium]